MAENKNDFTQGSIIFKLLKFMIPILGSLILQAMYGAVDILVVGRFGTTAGISGVSTGSNIVNLVTFTITGLAMGVTVLMGQYLGEKKKDKVGQLVGRRDMAVPGLVGGYLGVYAGVRKAPGDFAPGPGGGH